MALAMLRCTGGVGGSGTQGWEGLGSSSGGGIAGRGGSGRPLVRAVAAFAAWDHSPPAEWVAAMLEEVEGSSFLLTSGGVLACFWRGRGVEAGCVNQWMG